MKLASDSQNFSRGPSTNFFERGHFQFKEKTFLNIWGIISGNFGNEKTSTCPWSLPTFALRSAQLIYYHEKFNTHFQNEERRGNHSLPSSCADVFTAVIFKKWRFLPDPWCTSQRSKLHPQAFSKCCFQREAYLWNEWKRFYQLTATGKAVKGSLILDLHGKMLRVI